MADANVLSMTDASGALLWHPAGLADFDAIPARALVLWRDMRDGLASRGSTAPWMRPRGVPTSHHYAPSALGVPVLATCGHDPYESGPVAEWVNDPTPPLCRACSAVIGKAADPTVAWGTIGGVPVG